MKSTRLTFLTLALLVVEITAGMTAYAQGSGETRFNKDGLVFDYNSGWTLQEESNADAQSLMLGKADSDAQIRVFVFRALVNTSEKAAEAKKVLVDAYLNSTARQFEQMGAKPERVPAATEIANAKAEGVKIQAVLDGQGGAAEVYWSVIGQRLVVLTFFGPDKARERATAVWDKIRTSLQIEAPKGAETKKPAEKAKPN